jgi:hypothetical protein
MRNFENKVAKQADTGPKHAVVESVAPKPVELKTGKLVASKPVEPKQAAQQTVTKKPKKQPLVVGDFVKSLDGSQRKEFGAHRGVVVGVPGGEPLGKSFHTVVLVRVLQRTLKCSEGLLRRMEVRQSEFPLAQLPLAVLALVMLLLPMDHAARQAVVSRRFAAAFRDNVSWKKRCLEDAKGLDVEAVFQAENETSWMAFYRRHMVFRVRIVMVLDHGGERSVSSEFAMLCDPRMTVEAFLESVSSHREYRKRGQPGLKAHDPSRLGKYNLEHDVFLAHDRDAKPNCRFRAEDPQATVAEAGVCEGAVLEYCW